MTFSYVQQQTWALCYMLLAIMCDIRMYHVQRQSACMHEVLKRQLLVDGHKQIQQKLSYKEWYLENPRANTIWILL